MPSFFKDIKDYFHGGFHGRYFALLLRELARHEPESFAAILRTTKIDRLKQIAIAARKGLLEIQAEFPFRGKNQRRRADLAINCADGPASKLLLLFEIKEFDNKSIRNAAQLKDYLSRVGQDKNTIFLHISRFHPEAEQAELIEDAARTGRVASISYGEIHAALTTCKGSIARMLREYLEDIRVGTYKEINCSRDRQSLTFVLTRMLSFPHAHGIGKLNSGDAIAATAGWFEMMFNNLEFLSEGIRATNQSLFRKRFTRSFMSEPFLSLQALRRSLGKSSLQHGYAPGGISKYVEGGEVYFHAHANINGDLSLQFGIVFDVEKGRKRSPVRLYLYAGFYGYRGSLSGRVDGPCSVSSWQTRLTEEKAGRVLRHVLREAKANAMQHAAGKARSGLKSFVV
jgi:hypothetical protein